MKRYGIQYRKKGTKEGMFDGGSTIYKTQSQAASGVRVQEQMCSEYKYRVVELTIKPVDE